MPSTVLVDTGYFVALFREDDPYHSSAVEFMKNRVRQNHFRLVTAWPVITEACFFFRAEDRAKFTRWIAAGAVVVKDISLHDLEAIASILARYADIGIDFADACLIWLASMEKNNRILTTNRRDFDAYRTADGRPFERLWLAYGA